MSRAVATTAWLAIATGAIGVIASTACGDEPAATPAARGPSRLEASIAQAIGGRLGAPIVAHCLTPLPACFARLPDGNALAIRVGDAGSAWSWHVEGLLVSAAPLEAYVRDELDALGLATTARCGPPLRRAAPGDRIECRLGNGGAAWITVNADGSTSLELAIDAAAAAARGEIVTPDRERALQKQSRALEPSDDDDN